MISLVTNSNLFYNIKENKKKYRTNNLIKFLENKNIKISKIFKYIEIKYMKSLKNRNVVKSKCIKSLSNINDSKLYKKHKRLKLNLKKAKKKIDMRESIFYCLCKKSYILGEYFMITCKDCYSWFHYKFIKLTIVKVSELEEDWFCPYCLIRKNIEYQSTGYENKSLQELLHKLLKIEKILILFKEKKKVIEKKYYLVKFNEKKNTKETMKLNERLSFQLMILKNKKYIFLKQKNIINSENWDRLWEFQINHQKKIKKIRTEQKVIKNKIANIIKLTEHIENKMKEEFKLIYKIEYETDILNQKNKFRSSYLEANNVLINKFKELNKYKKELALIEKKVVVLKLKINVVKKILFQLKIVSNNIFKTGRDRLKKYFWLKQIKELPYEIINLRKKNELSRKNYLELTKNCKIDLIVKHKNAKKELLQLKLRVNHYKNKFGNLFGWKKLEKYDKNIIIIKSIKNVCKFCNTDENHINKLWICAEKKCDSCMHYKCMDISNLPKSFLPIIQPPLSWLDSWKEWFCSCCMNQKLPIPIHNIKNRKKLSKKRWPINCDQNKFLIENPQFKIDLNSNVQNYELYYPSF